MEGEQQNAGREAGRSQIREHVEVGTDREKSGVFVYLSWVALWVVALALLALITALV